MIIKKYWNLIFILLEIKKYLIYNIAIIQNRGGIIMAEIKLDFKNSGVTQKSIMEYKAQV